MKIIAATNNLHKIEELRPLFSEHTLLSPLEIGMQDFNPKETGNTFFENAHIKAEALFLKTSRPVLADDSGLCVEALEGRPGINSARYGSRGDDMLTASQKNELLLKELHGIADRRCAFVCCLILQYGIKKFLCIQETLEGVIADSPQGEGGFGYDPIVFLPEYEKTVAELSQTEKNRISHRGKAAYKMAAMLQVISLLNEALILE